MSQNRLDSITRGPRQSNFELLRIIAMFMVLVVHADYIALGVPDAESIIHSPVGEGLRVLFEAAGLCAVNIFVMISGWFGIRTSLKGYCNFAFQVLFFYVGSFCVMYAFGLVDITADSLTSLVCLRKGGWFVVSYSILYIFSPVLNAFISNAGKRQFLMVLVAFFAAQTFWGWIGRRDDFNEGYSAMSFCGLYLLSAYLKRYKSDGYKWGGVFVYLISTLLIASIMILQQLYGFPLVWAIYNDPLVIAAAAGLVVQFSRLDLGSSKVINFIAASSFAVYLFHDNPYIIWNVYVPLIQNVYQAYGGFVIAPVLVLIFGVSILLDQPRKWIWNRFLSKRFK